MTEIEQLIEAEVQRRVAAQGVAQAASVDGMPYVVVRTFSAGVHVGYLESRDGQTVVLRRARRCWRFYGVGGTGSCTELALHGPDPARARICEEIAEHTLLDAIEILPLSTAAAARIAECGPDAG